MRAGLHALRDRLTIEEAAQLSAQLPLTEITAATSEPQISTVPTTNAGSIQDASAASGFTPLARESPSRGVSTQPGMASTAPTNHTTGTQHHPGDR